MAKQATRQPGGAPSPAGDPTLPAGDSKQPGGDPTSRGGDPTPPPSDAQWRERLPPLAYNVTRKRLNEPAHAGAGLLAEARSGSYRCACCDAPLFGSAAKFDAGDGWPAFREALSPGALAEHEDLSWFTERTAVRCAACDAHIGHVAASADGARRYRANACALAFAPG